MKGKAAQLPPREETDNGGMDEVLTLTEAAAYLRHTESEMVGPAHAQGLPGRYVASEWRAVCP
jgi:hypothetical protein